MGARSRPDRSPSTAGLLRPRTIAGQLARILAVSLVLVLALLGLTVAGQVGEYRRSGETVAAVSLALAAQDLVHELQRERGLSNGLLGGDERLRQSVLEQRAGTDVALRNLSATLAADPPGAGEVRSALGHLTELPGTRSRIDTRTLTRAAAFQFYTDGIDATNRLFLGLDQARDPQVRHGLQALYALGDAKEFTARERGFLNGVFAAGEFAPGEYVQFLDIRAARTAALAQFGRDATLAQRDRLDAVLASENAARAAESENIAIASTAGPLLEQVDPAPWWDRMTAVIDDQRTVQQSIGADIGDRAQQLRRDAALLLAAFALAALLAVATEVALVFASVRAIVRPLARLAAEADEVAATRLPEVIAAWRGADTTPDRPTPVRTPPGAGVEIAAVAGALDRVQSTAFDLASEQALVRRNTTESMANLARRNQNLVRRQLGLISEFEREELDPKALSNLFELDHLATRMRRNAESLLVLVGEASPRRWAEPIALSDVIRAGLSEVDDYRRVALRRVDDIAVTGAVVSELAHILAELIENGLAFSPPDLEVEVYGRKLAGGYLLAVVDHGVGMPAEQLAEANARLRGEQDFIVASTRYLGHYVVGRLAARLGITVELTTSPVSGIVARLLLPPTLLADESALRTTDPTATPGAPTTGASGATSAVASPEASAVVDARADTAHSALAPAGGSSSSAVLASAGGSSSSAVLASAGAVSPSVARDSGGMVWPSAALDSGGMALPSATLASPWVTSSSAAPAPAGVVGDSSALPGSGESAYVQFLSSAPARADRTGHGDTLLPDAFGDPTEVSAALGDGVTEAARTLGAERSGGGSAGSTQGTHGVAPVERTRNGLVKRAKRPAPAPTPDRPRTPINTPAIDRTPDQTRSMLASFRTGHERGGAAAESASIPVDSTH